MTEEHEQELHTELVEMRTKLRYVLDNLNAVKGEIENVYFTLDELSEQTKGESE